MLGIPTSTPTVAAEDNNTPAVVSDFEDDDYYEYYDDEDEYSFGNDDDDLQNASSGIDRARIIGGVHVGKNLCQIYTKKDCSCHRWCNSTNHTVSINSIRGVYK
jgi:hypothetical protein